MNRDLTGKDQEQARKKAEMGLRHIAYYIMKSSDLLKDQYHNTDVIEPYSKSKDDVVYFWSEAQRGTVEEGSHELLILGTYILAFWFLFLFLLIYAETFTEVLQFSSFLQKQNW